MFGDDQEVPDDQGTKGRPDWVPDFAGYLERGVDLLFRAGSRADDGYAHVSMVSAMCYREVWAQRNGLVPVESGYDSQVRMDIGTALEPWILERLEVELGVEWHIAHQVPVRLWINKTGLLEGAIGKNEQTFPEHIVKGHADLMLTHMKSGKKIIVDIKTGGTVKHKANYPLQLTQYAIAAGAEYCAIVYFGRMDGKLNVVYFDPEDYREEVTKRVQQILKFTPKGTPEYLVGPNEWTKQKGGSWACGVNKPGYCNYTGCELNYLSAERTALRNEAATGWPPGAPPVPVVRNNDSKLTIQFLSPREVPVRQK